MYAGLGTPLPPTTLGSVDHPSVTMISQVQIWHFKDQGTDYQEFLENYM